MKQLERHLTKTKEGYSSKIAEHEATIRNHEQAIERYRETISGLEDNIRPADSDNVSQHTRLESQIETLQKELNASLVDNKKQAQKIAWLLIDPQEQKQAERIKLIHENEEKDGEIKSLKEQLSKLQIQIENENVQKESQSSSGPATVNTLDLHGLLFQDGFVKVPEALGKASMHKERFGMKFAGEDNTHWQKTRMIQDGIVIAGVPLNCVETIRGTKYACYEENGKQKRLRFLDKDSLVLHDEQYYISWEILKKETALRRKTILSKDMVEVFW